MLIDKHHRPANGAGRPTLCAYHAARLMAAVPVVDPEVLAAELLADIDSFTTADEVNLFLGNLVRSSRANASPDPTPSPLPISRSLF